jgi:UDP-2,3-diacylglucosamine pyrophosphatase LpxH
VRTLVVSDLHLGARGDHAVLGDPGCLRALCGAVAIADRLVLLGDVVELRERPLCDVLPEALVILRALGETLGGTAEVAVLAGNHDHRLVVPALERRERAQALGAAAQLSPRPGDPVGALIDALGPERTRIVYPGWWPRADVWATHGHYGDRHTSVPLLERLSAGLMVRLSREPARGPTAAEDYEAVLGPLYGWIDAIVETARSQRDLEGSERAWLALTDPSRRGLRDRALRAGFPVAIGALSRALRSGSLSADLSRAALCDGPLVAMGEVTRRLGVHADHVVFGHTHRAGPLPGDDPASWRTPGGAALLNTGCWVRESSLLGPDPARSPYRAGFAAWIDDDPTTPPELVNLLD